MVTYILLTVIILLLLVVIGLLVLIRKNQMNNTEGLVLILSKIKNKEVNDGSRTSDSNDS